MRKGWFKIPGVQDGDRTVEQQMKGLKRLMPLVQGKRVLDLGCAEGLIAHELVKAGAAHVIGYEIVADHVKVANTLHPEVSAYEVDLNDEALVWAMLSEEPARFEVCLMLAILHKLRNPGHLITSVLRAAGPDLIVIRTAARTPGFVQDARSGLKRYEFKPALLNAGYRLDYETHGPMVEWMGYFVKE